MKRLIMAAILALAGFAFAGDKGSGDAKSAVTIPQPLQEYYYTGLEPERLAYCIDLWYDAALKGDNGRAAKYEKMIHDIMRSDLDSTRQALSQFGRRIDESQRAELALDPASAQNNKFSPEILEAQDLYDQEWESYKFKEKLAGTIQNSGSFSNKYRLMSDYIEVLRRDVGLPKLKYAANQMKPIPGVVPTAANKSSNN
jgi:hypothetical protein